MPTGLVMIQCGKYAPQRSHKAHANKKERKENIFFCITIVGYMCLMTKKREEKNGFKYSCIWNRLVLCFSRPE